MGAAIENIFVIVGGLSVDSGSGSQPPLQHNTLGIGDEMARRRQNLGGGQGPTLKDVRDVVIVLECNRCDRRDAFERKVLVQQFGAAACLGKLRRRFAMGCERMCHADGDRCETKFACLDEAPLLSPRVP